VKIRGFRIELGEIEAALRGIDGVRDATVIVREDEPGDRRLVAYVVGESDAERLRDELRRGLPEHMVPGAFVAMDALPLTPNGKLDRRALPAPEYAAAAGSYVAPSNPVEQVLAEIWADVLRLERVGVRENFFAIGGHSLLATRIVARVRQVLDGEISIVTLFQRPTIGELAAVLRERGDHADEEPAIMRAAGDLSPLDGLDDIDDLSEEELDRLLGEISVSPVNE